MSEAFERARLGQLAVGREQANALDEFQTRRTNRVAGNALQTGDYAGAAGALYDGGNLEGGMAVQRYGQQSQTADRERQQAAIVAAVTGLLHVPPAERQAMLQSRIAPVFQQVGLGDYLGQIGPDDLSDASLRGLAAAMGGEVEQADTFNLGNGRGVVERDPYSGAYRQGYAPAFDAREGAGPGYMWTDETRTAQTYIPGGPADPRVVGTRAAAGRAPPRSRSGGGSRSSAPARPAAASGGGLPPGFTVRRP